MAIFTAIFGAVASAIGLTGFFATAFVAVGVLATTVGISYLLRKKPEQAAQAAESHFSAQGQLQASGDVPRSFIVGYSFTAGSLVYANEWGNDGDTPNAYHVQVIALSDLPSGPLREVWVNGEQCTLLSGEAHGEFGVPLAQYRKDGKDHLWVKYYNGRQTAADPYLVNRVSSADYPYEATRVGFGVAYVICTALVEDTLFAGFPTYKFVPGSIPLYDPSKDTTAGGDGPQRWSDRSTWGGDGDDLPVVQAYNILRGISYGGTWFYGAQRMSAARLPITNWLVQIAKCRNGVEGENGIEPAYRSGGQISVDQAPLDIITKLNTTCQGRLTEVGGFYKYHAGAPDSPSFSWTDVDLLSTEEHMSRPFFSLDKSTNGIQARYPDPAQGWSVVTAPAYHRPDLEARDGGRRLMATPLLDFAPYPAQVQRLQKSAIDEARRARTHELAFPPVFWLVEPGDVGQWTSTRNGYSSKLFRVDQMVDHANLDVTMAVTEVDPGDYDWDHETDYRGVAIGPTTFVRPAPQGTLSWLVEPYVERDTSGLERRPCIRLAWDGTLAGISGVAYRVREAESEDIVVSNQTPFYAEGAIIIRGLLPATDYEVEARLIPTAPRDMVPSDWMPVTTPDVRLTMEDLVAGIQHVIATLKQEREEISAIRADLSNMIATVAARGVVDKYLLHQETADSRAEVEVVSQALATLDEAFASYQTEVTAELGTVSASVTTNSSAIARLDGYAAARWSVTTNVNGAISGIELINGGQSLSQIIFQADKFKFQLPGYANGAPQDFLVVGQVGGVPTWGLAGNMVLDGTFTARMFNVGQLSAISVDAGDIRAGSLQSFSGKMRILLNDNRIEGWR